MSKEKVETVEMLGTLLRLKHDIELTESFSMNNFLKEHNVNSKLSRILKDNGMIKIVGGNHRKPVYQWVTVEPTAKMSEEVLKMLSIDMRGRKSKNKKRASGKDIISTEKNQSSETNKSKNKEKTMYAETKLLWGMITIKSRIYLK